MGTNIHVHDKGKVGPISTTQKGDIYNETNGARPPSVWGNGIFFLLSFALIIGAIYLLVSQKLSLAMSSLVFIAAILMFTVVGAFVLQASGGLKEENFMKLIAMSFRKLTFLRTTKQKE